MTEEIYPLCHFYSLRKVEKSYQFIASYLVCWTLNLIRGLGVETLRGYLRCGVQLSGAVIRLTWTDPGVNETSKVEQSPRKVRKFNATKFCEWWLILNLRSSCSFYLADRSLGVECYRAIYGYKTMFSDSLLSAKQDLVQEKYYSKLVQRFSLVVSHAHCNLYKHNIMIRGAGGTVVVHVSRTTVTRVQFWLRAVIRLKLSWSHVRRVLSSLTLLSIAGFLLY